MKSFPTKPFAYCVYSPVTAQRFLSLLLGLLALCCFAAPLSAQSLHEMYQRFPFRRPEATLTPSKTNLVQYDAANGYLSIETITNQETRTSDRTVFVLFIAEDGTKYYAYQEIHNPGDGDGCPKSALKIYVFDDGEWRDVTWQLLPTVRLGEFYGKKMTPKVIDHNGVISFTNEDNKAGNGLGVDFTLPRKGTTIIANLVIRCNIEPLPAYLKLYKECSFKTIELLWDKQNAYFLLGKRK